MTVCFVSTPNVQWTHKPFFFLGLACLLNKPKIKAQIWLVYKQINMNMYFYRTKSELCMNNLIQPTLE